MKFLCLVIAVCFSAPFMAQEDETIIDSSYTFTIVPKQSIPNLEYGNHLFRTEFEYVKFLNSDFLNPVLVPVFFSNKEMGLIIKKRLSSSCYGLTVESIYETDTKVIVNTKIIQPSFCTYDMSSKILFIKLRATTKELVFRERTERLTN